MEEINMRAIENNEIAMQTTTPTFAPASTLHSSLDGRSEPNQHPIAAIEGLPKRIKTLESVRESFESSKTGHADYYIWDSTVAADKRKSGIFVTCNEQGHIKPCTGALDEEGATGEDIFGVTVSSAAFVGGQEPANVNDGGIDSSIKRGADYGLVITNGLVWVRCASDVVVGSVVVADKDGLAVKKTDVQHGNKVVSIKTELDIPYAEIYLGLSPKQAVDIAGDVKNLKERMDTTISNVETAQDKISTLETKTATLEEGMSKNVNITGGTIGGWDVNENGLEKTIDGHKTVMNSAADLKAEDSYVFGVAQKGTQEGESDTWKFGVKPDGKVNILDGNVGNWSVGENGLRVEKTFTDVCTVCGWWTLKTPFVSTKTIRQNINFYSVGLSYMALEFNADNKQIKYFDINSNEKVAWDSTEGWLVGGGSEIDFGPSPQYVPKDFYDFISNNYNATPSEDASVSYQEQVSSNVVVNGNSDNNLASKVFEVKNNEESKFYVQADGDGYISNAGQAESATKDSQGRNIVSTYATNTDLKSLKDNIETNIESGEIIAAKAKGAPGSLTNGKKTFTFGNKDGFGVESDVVQDYFQVCERGSDQDEWHCDLLPSSDGHQRIGSGSNRLADIYVNNLHTREFTFDKTWTTYTGKSLTEGTYQFFIQNNNEYYNTIVYFDGTHESIALIGIDNYVFQTNHYTLHISAQGVPSVKQTYIEFTQTDGSLSVSSFGEQDPTSIMKIYYRKIF